MPSNFGTTPTSTTTLLNNQFPVSAGWVPNSNASGNLTSIQLGPASTDNNGYTSAPIAIYVADGSDTTLGTTTDASSANTLIGLTKAIKANTASVTIGTLPSLPAGSATIGAVKLTDGTITGTFGQQTMANSFPVVLASNQSALPASQSGTWNLNNISGTISLPTGASTDATVAKLNIAQGATLGSNTGPMVQGLVTASAPSYTTGQISPLSLTAAGALRVDASATTQPVSGTFWQATQPISAASLPLPTGAATAAKQPALGTAGAASSDVLTVQGIASMTALKVDGSGVTQPISGTITANAGTGTFTVGQATGSNLHTVVDSGAITATTNADTTIGGTTAPSKGLLIIGKTNDGTPQYQALPEGAGGRSVIVEGYSGGTAVPVSGTFWQATQPVSGTVSITANSSVNVNQIGGNAVVTGGASGLLAVGGPVASGSANADNPLKMGGVFNTTQPTVTTGQVVEAQATARGALIVATGVDAFATSASQSGTWNITNISGTVSLPTGAATAAKQPALGTAGSASADVITVQGIASMTALKVDGSGVTQPVSGTVTANAGTGTFTNQQSNVQTDYDTGAGTQNMTLFGMALPASGGAVAGGTSSNPLRIDPTGTTTQPISGTVTANAGTGTFTIQSNASVNVNQVAGAAVSTAASGVQLVGVADGAGNKLTSNSTTTTSKFGLDTNLLSILGTAPTTAGKLDVKGADGDVFVRQATASNLNVQAVGNVASGASDSGNPLKVGGVYNSSAITLTNGQRGDLQLDANGYLEVNIKAGAGSGGFSATDEAAWTAGTSSVEPVGGVYNDSATALTAGQEGTFRATANRALHVNLRDASANQLLGSKTSANSLPVVIASDQGAVPVSGTFWQATQPVSGTVTANQGGSNW